MVVFFLSCFFSFTRELAAGVIIFYFGVLAKRRTSCCDVRGSAFHWPENIVPNSIMRLKSEHDDKKYPLSCVGGYQMDDKPVEQRDSSNREKAPGD